MSELIELSVDEVQRFADVVRARIMHPSHTPVQAIRAGLCAVNGMRLDGARRVPVSGSQLAVPRVPKLRPADPPRARKVGRLGIAERSSEWMDRDGDRWRWCFMREQWQYKPLNPEPFEADEWIDCPSDATDGAPTSVYAPFTEVPRS
ncbi:hypothetical protein I5H06_gp31 [Mycobacterium phage SirPhilip]|uniref:DUF7183 domain-containing protein n=1 Tax=Mycobacterium phage SirPhilip TaxID=2015824 RepID=A0A222ZKJ4_9CAUD|nr:hypothetical protein I5H06_gp31 [Mycobacterium phage SirPhilip]ASR85273.1 hypothetical protein SEA_SIRPHILIP_71 [Mycobacterium phage SirPhilip]